MKHLLSALRAIFLLPATYVDWSAKRDKEWNARVAEGYCSSCCQEKAKPGYEACDGCYAIGK